MAELKMKVVAMKQHSRTLSGHSLKSLEDQTVGGCMHTSVVWRGAPPTACSVIASQELLWLLAG